MEIDKDRIDDAVLALLYLTLDPDGVDWDTMDRREQLFGEMFGRAE